MVQNIVVAVLGVVAVAAVVFGWWLDKGGQKKDADESEHNEEK